MNGPENGHDFKKLEETIMKKLIAMLLALAMVFAMTACGATENKETEPAAEVTTEATEEVTEEVTEEIAEDEEPVMELSAMETLLNQIVEINPVEFMGMAAPVDLTDADALFYYTGLTSAESVKEAAVYEPMIGSIAFSMVAVQVAEGADAEAVAEAMAAGIPCLVTRKSSMEEIAEDAALYVNAQKREDLIASIRRLEQDEELRNHLISEGQRHASRFRPEVVVFNLMNTYGRVHIDIRG